MHRLEFDVTSTASPNQILSALTDFSDRRPQIWAGIAPDLYKVYSVEETSADVQEGTKAPGMTLWARERYDWSQPGVVQWTVQESNFSMPGSYVRAEVSPRDGGSSIHLTWEREGSNLKGRFGVWMVKRMKGKPVLQSIRKGLDNIEKGLS